MRRHTGGEGRIIGRHVYGNLYDCPRELISDERFLVEVVKKSAELGSFQVWDIKSWSFGGDKGGVSIIALVIESHIAIHTWIEYNYATVDVYTCGDKADPEKAFDFIVLSLKPKEYTKHYADRSSR